MATKKNVLCIELEKFSQFGIDENWMSFDMRFCTKRLKRKSNAAQRLQKRKNDDAKSISVYGQSVVELCENMYHSLEDCGIKTRGKTLLLIGTRECKKGLRNDDEQMINAMAKELGAMLAWEEVASNVDVVVLDEEVAVLSLLAQHM